MKISLPIAQTNVNDANLTFYENIDVEHFHQFSKKIGLDQGPDIEAIFPLIKDAQSVMEVGAGYGRAIKKLLALGFANQVIAVDRVPHLVSYMAHEFKGNVQVELQDVRNLQMHQEVEVVLWLWSGIMEMSIEEYCLAFQRINYLLPEGGRLFIETPYKEIRVIGQQTEVPNLIHLDTQWGTIDAYLPTEEEITANAISCGFTSVKPYCYKTDTGITRVFYELFK